MGRFPSRAASFNAVRQILADRDAVAPLHDMEVGADHRGIVAQQIAPGGRGEDPPQVLQHPVLPGHVVGRRRYGAERRTPRPLVICLWGQCMAN